jgi:peptidoglycan/LPS O-acetylase OafA/YrhL
VGFQASFELSVLQQTVAYFPIFAAGVLLGQRSNLVGVWTIKKVTGVLLSSLMLVSLKWMVASEHAFFSVLQAVGAVMLVYGTLKTANSSVLVNPVAQWLGSRSFSIYLVHGPVVYFIAYLYGATPLSCLLMLTVSLTLSEFFERTLIQPTHKLARKLTFRNLTL